MSAQTSVLIVDDSAIVRMALRKALESHADIRVIGAAPDPIVAREMIERHRPDVMTLDIEMPRMNGLEFLRELMASNPIPTIIVSSLTRAGCDLAVQCLQAGAVDVVCKPGAQASLDDMAVQLGEIVRGARDARLSKRPITAPRAASSPGPAAAPPKLTSTGLSTRRNKVVALGASTGGTEALSKVLGQLPADCPGVVIVQHMPESFTTSFAQRLDSLSPMRVKEAADGDIVQPGVVLLATGNLHMKLVGRPGDYRVSVFDGPRICRHRPSVEILFESVARVAKANAIGAIMTGMGNDGAEGLKTMRDAGAMTIAQNEATCVVYGMPREAARLDAAVAIEPLDRIAARIVEFASGTRHVDAA